VLRELDQRPAASADCFELPKAAQPTQAERTCSFRRRTSHHRPLLLAEVTDRAPSQVVGDPSLKESRLLHRFAA
jgi:hypothetical protein